DGGWAICPVCPLGGIAPVAGSHCRRGRCRRAQPCAAGRRGPGRVPHRVALAVGPPLARDAQLPTQPFFKQFQILTAMAKDHLLPRYLLRAAVCVCVLLGFGFLAVFHAKDAKALRLFAKDAKDISLPPFANDSMRALREPTLREIYTAEIGIRETSGNNDGSRVGEYLRYCGL